LIFHIPEFSSHVWLTAFECRPADVEATLRAAQKELPNVCVQLVDLSKVAGSRYLLLACYNALKSSHSKQPISRTLSMEILLYASANRQISEAVRRVGITEATRQIAAIAVGPSSDKVDAARVYLEKQFGCESNNSLLDTWSPERLRAVKDTFSINQKELSATLANGEDSVKGIERLAIERSALLTVRK